MEEKKLTALELGTLMREGYEIRTRMAADRARLAEINAAVAEAAAFRAGSQTGHVAAYGVAAKVTLKKTVSWNQEKLRQAAKAAGRESFARAFDWEIKPRSARELQNWLAGADVPNEVRELVELAREERDAAPSVSYSLLEE